MKRILRVHSTKSNRSIRSHPSPYRTMPRRHVLIATLVAVIWGVNFVVIHVGLDSFPPLLFAALRFCLVALALPFVPRPGVPVKYVVARRRLPLRRASSGCCSSASTRACPPGLASLVLQLQAAFTVGLAVLFLGERPKPAQLAGGTLALVGIGIIAAGRASARPARRARADDRRRRLLGHRQRHHAQGRLPEPARPARLLEPDPAAAAAHAQPPDRARPAGRDRRQRRARAALRRRALDAVRLRRLGVAAGPAPGLDGRPVHAAGAGRRHRLGLAAAERDAERRRAAAARRWCSRAWR